MRKGGKWGGGWCSQSKETRLEEYFEFNIPILAASNNRREIKKAMVSMDFII
jgi:hypothetical protein